MEIGLFNFPQNAAIWSFWAPDICSLDGKLFFIKVGSEDGIDST